MHPALSLGEKELLERPVRFAELSGRIIIAIAFIALLYVLWIPFLNMASSSSAKELRVLPSVSVFIAAVLVALIIQGARPDRNLLLDTGLLALLCYGVLSRLPNASGPGAMQTDSGCFAPTSRSPVLPKPRPQDPGVPANLILQWIEIETAILSAIALGTWLGRGIGDAKCFVTVLACAAAGGLWLGIFHVPESCQALRWLRTPWPSSDSLRLSPAWTDLLFSSALIEAARHLHYPVHSAATGAVCGYIAASFLNLEPWPAWSGLSLLMAGSGIYLGCMPALKYNLRDIGRAIFIAAVLLGILMGISTLERRINAVPARSSDSSRYQNVT